MVRTLLFFGLVALSSTAYAQKNASVQTPASGDAVVSRVNRQVNSVERRIAQEDKRLQARMVQISTMRQTALKREDSRALKNVELLEKQAYKNYEVRMTRILSELEGDPTKPKAKRRTNTRTRSSSGKSQRKTSRQGSVSRRSKAGRGFRR